MSNNPIKRLIEHNSGRVKSTKSNRPWVIIWMEELPNRLEARKRERYLKSAAGRRLRKSLRAISSHLRFLSYGGQAAGSKSDLYISGN